jgi:hypothetical protein
MALNEHIRNYAARSADAIATAMMRPTFASKSTAELTISDLCEAGIRPGGDRIAREAHWEAMRQWLGQGDPVVVNRGRAE